MQSRRNKGAPSHSQSILTNLPHHFGHLTSGPSPSSLPGLARVLDCGKEAAQMRWAVSREDQALLPPDQGPLPQIKTVTPSGVCSLARSGSSV